MQCAQCGAENGDEFRFCGDCGVPLFKPSVVAMPAPLPLPAQRKTNAPPLLALFVVAPLVILAGVFAFNYLTLQRPLNDVLQSDTRNAGVDVSAHYGYFLVPSVLVFEVKSISGTNSRLDVSRVLLQFAEKMRGISFSSVELAYGGKTKFKISGAYFKTLGDEYSWQNPVYTLRTFPSNVKNPDGSQAYSDWSGGIFAVTAKQMEDLNDLHDKWYWNDALRSVR